MDDHNFSVDDNRAYYMQVTASLGTNFTHTLYVLMQNNFDLSYQTGKPFTSYHNDLLRSKENHVILSESHKLSHSNAAFETVCK